MRKRTTKKRNRATMQRRNKTVVLAVDAVRFFALARDEMGSTTRRRRPTSMNRERTGKKAFGHLIRSKRRLDRGRAEPGSGGRPERLLMCFI